MVLNINQISKAAPTSTPTTGAGQGTIFPKVINGIAEACWVDSNGVVTQLTSNGTVEGGGGGSSNFIQERYENTTGVTIPANSVVQFNSDKTISLADITNPNISIAGITVNAIPTGTFGYVYKSGICAGVLASLSPAAGAFVYVGPTLGSMTLTAPSPGGNQAIIRLGQAGPPDDSVANANDLFMDVLYESVG